MVSRHDQFRQRAYQFALQVIRLYRRLPRTDEARIIGRQLLRSATSVAANYRAAGRSRSKAEFVSKMGTVVEEADETVFWLELLVDAQIVSKGALDDLSVESQELLAIFAASYHTAKRNRQAKTSDG